MTEKVELSQPGETPPQRIHSRWLETARAGLFVSLGVGQGALALRLLSRAGQIRRGIEAAFSIAQEMGTVVSSELIQEVSDSAARLSERGSVIALFGALTFFTAGSIKAYRAARR